jgi:uncharacterized protein
MKPMMLCDASALIALINQGDTNHGRCVATLTGVSAPLITTWSCFTEAMHLLGRYGGWAAQYELWSYVIDQILVFHFHNLEEQVKMQILMEQYRDVPMDLADASLVAASETLNCKRVFTLDRDFYIYRFQSNQSFEVFPS